MDSTDDSGKILMESLFGNFDQESSKILSFWQMTRERFESQKNDYISALQRRRDEGQNVFCFFFTTGITSSFQLVLCPSPLFLCLADACPWALRLHRQRQADETYFLHVWKRPDPRLPAFVKNPQQVADVVYARFLCIK